MSIALKPYEQLTKDIKEVEAKLTKDLREVEARLTKDIKELEVKLTKGIKDVEIRLVNTIHRQTLWTVGSIGAIIGFIRFLDWLLNLPPAR